MTHGELWKRAEKLLLEHGVNDRRFESAAYDWLVNIHQGNTTAADWSVQAEVACGMTRGEALRVCMYG